ncbi:MAG: TMEM175 family protein [Actinomycetota bacterium]
MSVQDPDTSRLETFADGVMAIAITLLILEIDVPHVDEGHSLTTALADQWPSYAAYSVSFITIGIMWVNHHHMFTLIRVSNHMFLVLNVVFLMTIAALPWPTALLAEYIRDADERTVATLVYGGTMVAIAIMFNVVWRYAAGGHRLLVPEADAAAVETITRSYILGPVSYTVATLLAFVDAWISLALFAALAGYYLLPVSGPRAERIAAR